MSILTTKQRSVARTSFYTFSVCFILWRTILWEIHLAYKVQRKLRWRPTKDVLYALSGKAPTQPCIVDVPNPIFIFGSFLMIVITDLLSPKSKIGKGILEKVKQLTQHNPATFLFVLGVQCE